MIIDPAFQEKSFPYSACCILTNPELFGLIERQHQKDLPGVPIQFIDIVKSAHFLLSQKVVMVSLQPISIIVLHRKQADTYFSNSQAYVQYSIQFINLY